MNNERKHRILVKLAARKDFTFRVGETLLKGRPAKRALKKRQRELWGPKDNWHYSARLAKRNEGQGAGSPALAYVAGSRRAAGTPLSPRAYDTYRGHPGARRQYSAGNA